jgi:hypothetical protein
MRPHKPVAALVIGLLASLLLGAACPRKADTSAPPPAPSATDTPTAPPSPPEAPPEAAPPQPAFTPQPDGARVAILYTASVQGYVTPCGCTADPLGGVARLAAMVDAARAAYGERVLLLDAGDLLFERPEDNLPADACQADARAELLLGTYARKGLAATVLGPLDDVRGPGWRDERLAKHGIVTVGAPAPTRKLVAGAKHETGRLLVVGGVKVGVTGFRVDEEAGTDSAKKALVAEVARLREQGAVAVVALAQAPLAMTRKVATDVTGLEAVILGRDPGEVPREPTQLGASGPWLVASGAQAQHLGIVELVLDGREGLTPLPLDDRAGEAQRRARVLDARIEQYEKQVAETEAGARRDFVAKKLAQAVAERAGLFRAASAAPPPAGPHLRSRAVALVRGSDEETQAKAALDAYEAAIPDLVKKCEANITCPEPKKGEPTYVGVEACYTCHRDAVKFWQKMAVPVPGKDESGADVTRTLSHATAWATLKKKGKDKDRSCIGCHSIGFNEPGGYCRASDVDFRENVQCEACHGPGSAHVDNAGDPASLVVRGVGETTCRKCHHVPHIPTTESFVFAEKIKHILGEGHGLEKLKEIREKH